MKVLLTSYFVILLQVFDQCISMEGCEILSFSSTHPATMLTSVRPSKHSSIYASIHPFIYSSIYSSIYSFLKSKPFIFEIKIKTTKTKG